MKHLVKFAAIGALLMSSVGASFAQQSGTHRDRTGNQSTGGSGNQVPDSQQKKSQGGSGG